MSIHSFETPFITGSDTDAGKGVLDVERLIKNNTDQLLEAN
jgi:hypothetical protein